MESNPYSKSSPKSNAVGWTISDRKDDDGFLVSCWGRLKLMKLIQWTKRRSSRTTARARGGSAAAAHHRHPVRPHASIAAALDCKSIADSLSVVQPRPVSGGFNYDPLSYAQNFDEGTWHDHDLEAFQRGFTSRYAAPIPAPAPRHAPPLRSLIDE